MKEKSKGGGVDHCDNLTRPELRPPAARLSACSFADFLNRIDLADFLLETFAGFSRSYIAHSVKNIFIVS